MSNEDFTEQKSREKVYWKAYSILKKLSQLFQSFNKCKFLSIWWFFITDVGFKIAEFSDCSILNGPDFSLFLKCQQQLQNIPIPNDIVIGKLQLDVSNPIVVEIIRKDISSPTTLTNKWSSLACWLFTPKIDAVDENQNVSQNNYLLPLVNLIDKFR